MEMHPLFKQIQANWFSQSGAISIKCNIDILKCDLRFLVILLCIIHLLVKRLDMVVYKNLYPQFVLIGGGLISPFPLIILPPQGFALPWFLQLQYYPSSSILSQSYYIQHNGYNPNMPDQMIHNGKFSQAQHNINNKYLAYILTMSLVSIHICLAKQASHLMYTILRLIHTKCFICQVHSGPVFVPKKGQTNGTSAVFRPGHIFLEISQKVSVISI